VEPWNQKIYSYERKKNIFFTFFETGRKLREGIICHDCVNKLTQVLTVMENMNFRYFSKGKFKRFPKSVSKKFDEN